MRYCVLFSFDIEADNHDQAMERLKDLKRKIDGGASRLGIGFKAGSMMGTAQPPPVDRKERRQVSA